MQCSISICDIGLKQKISFSYEMVRYKIKFVIEICSLKDALFFTVDYHSRFKQNLAIVLVIWHER
jgi:hypothetical protein